MGKTVYIGSGAGFSGDRLDAAVAVVATLRKRQGPRYLIFEVLAERTLAIAQRIKMRKPDQGYSPYLEAYLEPILADCKSVGITIVTNMGVANPLAAARQVHALAGELGIQGLKVAVVLGDDLTQVMSAEEIEALPTIEGLSIAGNDLLAANVYLGARPIAEALEKNPDVLLLGRSTDAALVLGPLIYEFGWAEDDWQRLAAGTLAGHLLECGGQVTGGYFCDPGMKDVPGMDDLGFPIGEIAEQGEVVITKADNTGGLVSPATVTEQLLYEMHDPANYLTPDVTLDVTAVSLEQQGEDRVAIVGAQGKPPPKTLKVTLSADGGWLGEADMIYAGPNAYARAQMAVDIVQKRLTRLGLAEGLRLDIVGTGSVFDNDSGERRRTMNHRPGGEFRLRSAVRTKDKARAERINNEVLSLFCSGPAAGGGYRCNVTGQVTTASALVPREQVEDQVRCLEVEP